MHLNLLPSSVKIDSKFPPSCLQADLVPVAAKTNITQDLNIFHTTAKPGPAKNITVSLHTQYLWPRRVVFRFWKVVGSCCAMQEDLVLNILVERWASAIQLFNVNNSSSMQYYRWDMKYFELQEIWSFNNLHSRRSDNWNPAFLW